MSDEVYFFGFLIGLFLVGIVVGWTACSMAFLRKFYTDAQESD